MLVLNTWIWPHLFSADALRELAKKEGTGTNSKLKKEKRDKEGKRRSVRNYFFLFDSRWLTVYTVSSPSSSSNGWTSTLSVYICWSNLLISFGKFPRKFINIWSRTLAVISIYCPFLLSDVTPAVYKLNLNCLSLFFWWFVHWPDQWLICVVNQCIDFLRLCIPSKVCTALYCSDNFRSIMLLFILYWIICFSLNLYALCGISCPSIL